LKIRTMLEALMNAHSAEAEAAKIRFHLETDGETIIQGDAFLVKQAIDNLLRNAIDFSPMGGEITLRIFSENAAVVIEIIDQGPGIPEYAVDRIFERFYSLPRPNSGQKSSGLGLNFAREVAQLHKGTLELINLENGTCARLSLPERKH
ncbi:MAG: two-component system sensor histidine kinase CreC, partial [Pseudomonadales bacterium]|nr:two-component system sensor histidine kinase CreC [Pseudomonadales bacterium]